jgi:hypothetical protein
MADRILCRLDASAGAQYGFDFEKREVIVYLKYERYGMSSKNPSAITISPSRTPSAWIGPKNGICGAVCDHIPNISAMPEKTAITYPVAIMRKPMSAAMERSIPFHKPHKLV